MTSLWINSRSLWSSMFATYMSISLFVGGVLEQAVEVDVKLLEEQLQCQHAAPALGYGASNMLGVLVHLVGKVHLWKLARLAILRSGVGGFTIMRFDNSTIAKISSRCL